jgi:hypothetical protein
MPRLSSQPYAPPLFATLCRVRQAHVVFFFDGRGCSWGGVVDSLAKDHRCGACSCAPSHLSLRNQSGVSRVPWLHPGNAARRSLLRPLLDQPRGSISSDHRACDPPHPPPAPSSSKSSTPPPTHISPPLSYLCVLTPTYRTVLVFFNRFLFTFFDCFVFACADMRSREARPLLTHRPRLGRVHELVAHNQCVSLSLPSSCPSLLSHPSCHHPAPPSSHIPRLTYLFPLRPPSANRAFSL